MLDNCYETVKKKNNRIYSHLNFFLSHSFPTVCSPHPFVRICGLPSLCSGLFPPQCVSLASWFQNNHCDFKFPHLPWTFVYTLSMFGQNVLFCLVFFFLSENILQLQQYETHHMKQTKLCVADGRKTYYSLRSKHDIFIKLHKYTHLHVC